MFDFPINTFLPVLFFIFLALSVLSALTFLYPGVPLKFVQIHIGIITILPVIALISLIFNAGHIHFGPFHFNVLSWLLSFFVLTIGLIVQRFSVRYLLGDLHYRKYFAMLTLITVFDAMAWLSDDLRFMLLFWGAVLVTLTMLIRLKKEWPMAVNAAVITGRVFALSWLLLLIAIVWTAQATGTWQLSLAVKESSLAHLGSWEAAGIGLLFVLSVIIPAAQWPFQHWLINSVVTPTPVSAVMHAGMVNVGSIILTLFAPVFIGDIAQSVLLVLSGISVLIGTGITLVQTDYKRQLVGSTMAQMGFMLIQCALGAYTAAITHAVLHGLFKSTLFLQSGSALQQRAPLSRLSGASAIAWKAFGTAFGLLAGIGFWLMSPGLNYQLVSALILGWSVTMAWSQLTAYDFGRMGRMIGLIVFSGSAVMFVMIHTAFNKLLSGTVSSGTGSPAPLTIILLLILLLASAAEAWFSRHKTSKAYALLYLWIVRFGEPQNMAAESHPKYLVDLLSKGGRLR
ncbi:MAG: NADH dehydrogenase subunit 5 [Tuberibacillus sp.]